MRGPWRPVTGGYSHARQRLPKLFILRLRQILNPEGRLTAYVLDGSSLELEASARLRHLYPPAHNQHGSAHWPVLRVLVLHELETGLAEEPQWGAMYGPAAVSEQGLAEKALDGRMTAPRLLRWAAQATENKPKLRSPTTEPS